MDVLYAHIRRVYFVGRPPWTRCCGEKTAASRPAGPPSLSRRLRPQIAIVSETENEVANDAQEKQQKHPKRRAPAKGLRETDGDNDQNHEIDKGNEVKHHPPARLADNLHQDVNVVDRNDASPPRLPGLLKNFPKADDQNNHKH